MKFSLIFLILIFISSCSNGLVNKNNRDPFTSSGFALIYNDDDFKNKIISRKLNNDLLEVGHYKIKRNSIVKITNPQNKKSLELKVTKNLKYPDFFKIVITENVLLMLDLDPNIPFVDIEEKIKNESFIAKKAVTHSEEKRVSNKAPITKVKILNISKKKQKKTSQVKKFTIIVGDFYSEDSAINLKNTLENNYVKNGSLMVKKMSKNKFRLFSGPYTSISSLKNVYFELNKYGFDNLDVKQHD